MFVLNNAIATFNFNLVCSQNKIFELANELGHLRTVMERTKNYIHFIRVIILFYEKTSHFALDGNYLR